MSPFRAALHHDVALVIADLGGGGAQRVLTTLANRWAAAGRRVAVITFSHPDSDSFALNNGVTRISLGARHSRSPIGANLSRVRALRRALKASSAPTVLAFVGATNVLAVAANIGLGKRLLISERNDPALQSLGRAWDLLRRLAYARAAVVTANSRSAIESLARFVPRQKLVFVPNPLVAPATLPERRRENLILNVGRLAPQKAQDVLLAAFALLVRDAPGWRLVILGDGPERPALALRARALGVEQLVDFPGYSDPWPYYARASVFALPSHFEGTPNALLEAMSMGVPAVVTDASGGPLEVVSNGVSGIVVPPGDPTALAAALKALVSDSSLRERMGEAAVRSVRPATDGSALRIWDDLLGFSSPS